MRRIFVLLSAAVCLTPGLGTAQSANRVAAHLQSGKHQTIVVYGTSLTADGAWVKQLQVILDHRYPGLTAIINSGSAGCWSQWGVDNLDGRVIKEKPDAVIIEFAVNDSVARFNCTVQQSRTNLESMVTRILSGNPDCEIILMTTTPADAYPKGHFSHRENISVYYEMYREVAKKRKLAIVDLYPQWIALRDADKKTFAQYVPDSIHINEEGCRRIVTPGILKALGIATEPVPPADSVKPGS
ncbi:MAG: SGNH/GDSL hydrolase family protein [Verrucomicrobia bacterium]|nr:SGNH/GDSL hydrolase family protein [Verrucomicrobiota bacterium]MCG2678946.1 GDSL-type esterase/lipase family protein [Kiritimatiellia bacterium]MBU4248283.1 SGNH/GDSL hydrolase family protein [Verrucomicrobiota bacterium]MBU4291772.1 SGNH/GDSL hydrolase family protein [Verrucomicrobiota bacterium]MBU4429168.1 SGNH/GDSL hydrolase family protein [Verrucomicrobiota bacterium]